MKIIVAGSRNFNDWNLLKDKLDKLFINKTDELEIVSGKCPPHFIIIDGKKVKIRGADRLGEIYARINKHKCTKFSANWRAYGKSAGPIRNSEMAKYADGLALFWDGISKGSENMLKEAKKRNLANRVINING